MCRGMRCILASGAWGCLPISGGAYLNVPLPFVPRACYRKDLALPPLAKPWQWNYGGGPILGREGFNKATTHPKKASKQL